MKRLYRLVGCIAAASLGAPAGAQWFGSETTGASGSIWSVDFSNVRDDGETVTAWVEVDYSKDRTEKLARNSKLFYRMNCAEDTYRLLAATTFRADGTVLSSVSEPDSGFYSRSLYDPVVPGSVIEYIYDEVCTYVQQEDGRS